MSGIYSQSSGSFHRAGLTSGSTHSAHSLSSRPRMLHSTAAALGGRTMVPASPKCWGPCCSWAALSPTASPGLSSWCQASASWHDPFSPGPPTATEAAPSPVVSPGLSQCRDSTALHDPFMPLKPVLGDSYTTKSGCQYKV